MGDDSTEFEKVQNIDPNQDELTIMQHREIEKEISEKIKLVGDLENLKTLEMEYINDDVYCKKVQSLLRHYDKIRRTRPDGNCFFRAFGYGYFEQLLTNKEKYVCFKEFAKGSKDRLISMGYPQFTVEDFHEIFMEVINITGQGPNGQEELYKMFNEQGYSDYVVVYLRLIASAHLQDKSEFYQNFIEGNRNMKDFCKQEVEPMYKESDHIHIIALSSALGVGVRVQYMDRGGSAGLDPPSTVAHDFPEGCHPDVHLLYRPGHYDLLYPTDTIFS